MCLAGCNANQNVKCFTMVAKALVLTKINPASGFLNIASVPLAQRIARWTSNPKVLGSIPRWDDLFFVFSKGKHMDLLNSLG